MAGGNSGTAPVEIRPLDQSDPFLDVTIDDFGESISHGTGETRPKIIPYHRPERTTRQKKGPEESRANDDLGHRVQVIEEIKNAITAIERAKESVEPMERAVEASYLEDCLKRLWELRGIRENEFKDLTNLLYLNLKDLTFERITNDQLDAYSQVLGTILRRTVRVDDFHRALDILEAAGITPESLLAKESEE